MMRSPYIVFTMKKYIKIMINYAKKYIKDMVNQRMRSNFICNVLYSCITLSNTKLKYVGPRQLRKIHMDYDEKIRDT